ncbi:MAG TPA: thiamine-binding protein [Actinomycetota bacterium]|nr:thiamine-binding protein [Actinomycetota bacterium]
MGRRDPVAVGEFTIYPFVTERLEPYVQAALEETRRSGLEADVGPLGTTVRGPLEDVLALLDRVHRVAFARGATKVVTRVELEDGPGGRA